GAKIDIEEDGTIHIFAVDQESGDAARAAIDLIVKEPEVGEVYEGTVKTITAFGAFVEILPGKDGLCHVSKLDYKRIENVEDYVKVGDKLTVKVMEIDESTGKISLSHKDTMPAPEGYEERPQKREPRRDGNRSGNRSSNHSSGHSEHQGNRQHTSEYKKPEQTAAKQEPKAAPKQEPASPKPESQPIQAEKHEEKGGFFSKIFK
ncbi:MAG: S1 RNA-binding domain-containing protein, partial [Clostridiales bacterium]|nr:S1 RNA-binding domain-containing protein [Clostridiales bacterium]